MPTVTILQGDWVERLRTLPDQSVHCCVTSPPYDKLRTYGGFAFDFEAGAAELVRVMCPGGIICWNVADQVVNGSESLSSFRQAIYFVDVLGMRLHDTMIYEKFNFSSPEQIRYHQAFEYVFLFSNGRPRCFNPIRDRKNIYGGQTAFGKNTKRQANGKLTAKRKVVYSEYGMRTNVWRGPTSGQESPCSTKEHPATMPEWLARDLILSWSNVEDMVLDPLCGSGTVGKLALELGRKVILIDIKPDYCKLAYHRTFVTPGLPLA